VHEGEAKRCRLTPWPRATHEGLSTIIMSNRSDYRVWPDRSANARVLCFCFLFIYLPSIIMKSPYRSCKLAFSTQQPSSILL
jgi:hypothetical protein